MSIEEVHRFLEKVETDAGFGEKFEEAATTEGDTSQADLWSLVRDAGFEFSAEEYKSVTDEAKKQRELSDQELEHVAGGFFGFTLVKVGWWRLRS